MNRVRYAPSPTGLQHIGGLRTALFNYFFARSTGGVFILRIEDTDRQRFDPAAIEDLNEMLNWMGIEYDEGPDKEGEFGPYVQSERLELYQGKAAELCDKGMAYPCFCSEERLESLRSQQKSNTRNIGYDRICRQISPQEANSRIQAGEDYVLRLKIPLEGKMRFEDAVLGSTGRKNSDLSPDPVIMKADGYPTYHLANVVDDYQMRISHVLRAQEWLPSAPLHLHIYRAFGWKPPVFCHLPMVMGTDGSKISKRHGATAVSDFRREGYLPEALMNFVSLLGWSYDDRKQMFSREELCRLFSLKKINKAPAVFDYRKLDWFNGQYVRSYPSEKLKEALKQILIHDGIVALPPTDSQNRLLDKAFPVIRERLKKLNDVSGLMAFLYSDPGTGNTLEAVSRKLTVEETLTVLHHSMEIIGQYAGSSVSDEGNESVESDVELDSVESDEELEDKFRKLADEKGWKIGDLFLPLRFALTASRISPPIIPSIRLLGPEECKKRIKRLIESLKVLE